MPIITLTTDFGHADWYVGAMKGAILQVNPAATLVDITHMVPAGDIRAGALALAASFRFFPKGTIHVAVVDPGVGGPRLPILVQSEDFAFVGPDNGLLSFALMGVGSLRLRHLAVAQNSNRKISQTFHGRDLFGPAAARLSLGIPAGKLGYPLKQYTRLAWPEPLVKDGQISGEILYADQFGNLLTNIPESALQTWEPKRTTIHIAGSSPPLPLVASYDSVPTGGGLAIVGSSGFLEIAVNKGAAKDKFNLGPGDAIQVTRQTHKPGRKK